MLDVIRKVLAILSPEERRELPWLFGAMLLMGAVEVVGIASILPFVAVVSDPSIIETQRLLSGMYNQLGFGSQQHFILFLGILVLLILLAGNAVSAFTTWTILKFTWARNDTLAQRLLLSYLKRPYTFFLGANSSDLGKNILHEVGTVVIGVLLPGMQLLARMVVAGCIVAMLLFVDPIVSITIAIVLGGAYSVIYLVARRRLTRIGQARLKANNERYQAADEVLGGVKELKLLGRESFFVNRFARASERFSTFQAMSGAIGQLPRYALEVVAFGGVLIVVLYLLALNKSPTQIIPFVALYAFAGYRLMPALQQIFSGATSVRFNSAALDVLYRDLVLEYPGSEEGGTDEDPRPGEGEAAPEPIRFKDSVRVEDVTFAYPGSETDVLRHVTFEVAANSTVGFVGSTGSGKTTCADLVLGLLRPRAGRILIDGTRLTARNWADWRTQVGYVPQQIYLSDDTLRNNIAFGVPEDQIDDAAVEEAARAAQIHEFITQELPSGYDTLAGERGVRLSGGQRQRVGIARALYSNPALLVLDEGTSALDPITEASITRAIRALSGRKTIILIAHRLATVRHCDRIFLFDRGQIIASGTYEQLVADSTDFRQLVNVATASESR